MERMSHDEFILKKRNEIRDIAERIMMNEADAIEGCRLILSLLDKIEFPHNDVYLFFIGIVSQTDDIPRGDYRNTCAEQFLKTKDREANEFVSQVRSTLVQNCQELINFLNNSRYFT